MPEADNKQSLTRQLAAILFADIQGYTALMQKDEKAASLLLRKFRVTVEDAVPASSGRIVDFYGDGVLCLFDNPLQAIECGIVLQKGFLESPNVPVRIGIHSGIVVNEENRIYGNSVNVTSRIESMAIPGSVLLSDKVRDEIKNHPELEVTSLGSFFFKNVDQPIEVFALLNEGLKVPKKSEITGKFKTKSSGMRRHAVIGTAVLAAIFVAAYFLVPWAGGASNKFPPNSIAVMPFENRSTVAENEFFADGIHDDLLTQLGKIGDMKVIARSSVMRFKESRPLIAEIAKMLGVSNIMEGSVSRLGDQVHINVQLIKAATSETLWSEVYDRQVTATNLFSIQTEIAKNIASVLKTAISPQQQESLAQQPTENLKAYEDYLRAHQLIEVRSVEALNEAKRLLEGAIVLDEQFALAYIQLGTVYALLVEQALKDEDTYFELAWENLDKGMKLDPLLVQAHALKGFLYYRAQNNLEEATASFEKAIAMNPNYGPTYLWYANAVLELGGDMKKARELLQNALRINPLSPVLINRVALYSAEEGDLQTAIRTYRKGIEVEPAYPNFWKNLCDIYSKNLGKLDSSAIYAYQSTVKNHKGGRYLENLLIAFENLGMFDETKMALRQAPLSSLEDSMIHLLQQIDVSMYTMDFEKAKVLLERLNEKFGFPYKIAQIEADFFQRDYEATIETHERLYPDSDGGEHLHPFAMQDLKAFQIYVYCLQQVGKAQKARELWEKYGEIVLSKPEGQAEYYIETKAREFFAIRNTIMEGRYQEAIASLDQYFESGYLARWQYIRMDPTLDPLRDLSEFKKVMGKVETKVSRQRTRFEAYLENQE